MDAAPGLLAAIARLGDQLAASHDQLAQHVHTIDVQAAQIADLQAQLAAAQSSSGSASPSAQALTQ